jgi:hypothetical protein
MIEFFIVYLSHYSKMPEIVFRLTYNRLLPNPSQFITRYFNILIASKINH